jgi:hypothetical protein
MLKKYIYFSISSLSFNITIILSIISTISLFALFRNFNKKFVFICLSVVVLIILAGFFCLEEIIKLFPDLINLLDNNFLGSNHIHMITPGGDFPIGDSPVDPLPGVKCPACLRQGIETWVLPGKHCPRCGHPC